MRIIQDSREQSGLLTLFPKVEGVTVEIGTLPVGDYACRHTIDGRELPDPHCVERKALGDLATSFASGYEREKAKWTKAHQLGLRYILAIEGTRTDVLQNDSYRKEGESYPRRKDGLAQLRQLCSLQVRYGITVWFCENRRMMAFYLLEFFSASGRWLQRREQGNA